MAHMTAFDAIVIGTGQSGPSLAVRLAKAGRKVAVIERHLVGGTCVNTGCIPTKTLVASARTAHVARRAADYGVIVEGGVRVDMAAVKARKEHVLMQSRTGVEHWLEDTPGCTLIRGHARFTADHEVTVNDQQLTAPEIFLNVGGRAAIPSLPGLDRVPYLTNTSILELDTLPEHLVIYGGSYIALEFAQMYRRFGSKVTVMERGPHLAFREDTDVSDTILQILRDEGVDVQLNTTIRSAEEFPPHSHLLIATGRRPNTDDLGLDRTTIACDARGYIQVDDELRTTAPGVWAIGDCNGKGAFTHTSYNDYEIVAANLLDHDRRRVSDRITAYNLYIDPPLGRVGMTDHEIERTGRKVLSAKRQMTRVGRAVEKGETQGFMKITVDAETRQILGAAILGVEGDEAIHCILDVMYARAPYTVLQRAMHIHPTVSELIPTLLGDLQPRS
jgi:pyruvate/2-oxoglutarate dehydrogenase complex dihydrolipoamide dehydrogenase (E3) component